MSIFGKLKKSVCCALDLVLATRIIAFAGLTISAILLTFLIQDAYLINNYEVSRKTALALGLDWQHIHINAGTSYHSDPNGKMISTIVLCHSSAFLVFNSLLMYATIENSWQWTIPWIVIEFLSCLSKLVALIYHLNTERNVNVLFITGSVIYIVTMIWWEIVVCTAALVWKRNKKTEISGKDDMVFNCSVNRFELSTKTLSARSCKNCHRDCVGKGRSIEASPALYWQHSLYSVI